MIPASAVLRRSRENLERRVKVSNFRRDPMIERAVERLDALLASGQQLRTDVPRGYYIDIVV